MTALAGTLLRWLMRHLLTLLVIFAVLLLWRVGSADWHTLQSARAESAQLTDANLSLTARVAEFAQAVTARTADMQTASRQMLEQRITEVNQQITAKQLAQQHTSRFGEVLRGTPIAQAQLEHMRLAAEIHLLEKERAYLLELSLRLASTQSDQAQHAKLEVLRQVHQRVYQQWWAVKRQAELLQMRHPVKSLLAIGSPEFKQRQQLLAQQDMLLNTNRLAAADYAQQLVRVQHTRPLAPLAAFEIHPSDTGVFLQPLRTRLEELTQYRTHHWLEKWLRPVEELAPTAFLILLSIIFTPLAIKALFYFVLAPLATRRPPVCLMPDTSGALLLQAGHSAVSHTVMVDEAHELLVHPEFLQSSSTQGDKDTRWLLDWRYPFTSLASNMVALTRIRTHAPAAFVISATQDPFSEIGVLQLPSGAALVMQPHNLVGVLQPLGAPLRITSKWRLHSLHAWLTLQLRYLVLHGPAELVVQGCRGVRVERADAGRSINQASTIGFSANLSYATRRVETFSAYLLGKQALLNDNFSGDNGFYVYEEMPHFGKKSGVAGRGLEGFTDSLLKVFGI